MKSVFASVVTCCLLVISFEGSGQLAKPKVKQVAVDLTAIDPGRYDASWWNRAPFRLVQTNLREIDATMDVDAYVQSMVDASVNTVLINVGGIVANYPTKLPYEYRNPYMKGDLVGDLVKGLKAKGIRVIGRFDFSKINEKLAVEKPEWLYVGTDGKNVNYNGQVHTCINGGYQQQYAFDILKEAITNYPLDGIFFNMAGYVTFDYHFVDHGICQCQNCKKRFKDSTGHELPVKSDLNDPVFREFNAFKKITSEQLFQQIQQHIKSLNPKLMIYSYTDAGVDMIASESGSEVMTQGYEWNYLSTDNVKRTLGSWKDRSPGNLLIYFQAIGFRHVGTSPNLARVWLLEELIHGAPMGFVVVGTLVNYEDRVFIPTLNEIYGFHKKYENLFTNLQAVNKVALVRGSRDEYEGFIKILSEEHIMYDIIEPAALGSERMPRKLQDYEALILPDLTNMDDRLISIIDNYVKNGGKLIATGFPSTRDASGKSLNKIRLQSLGVMSDYELFKQARSTYLKVSPADKAALGKEDLKDFSLIMMYSDFMKVKPQSSAASYLRLVPETRFGPPEKAYYTEENITEYPGVVTARYGNGKSVFIPWKLGTQYEFKGNYAQRILFLAALRNILKVDNTIVTDASPLIEMSHLANRNGAFEWIGMINHSGQIGGSFRESVPIYNTMIRFKPAKPVKAVNLLRAGKPVSFKSNNGWVELTVPKLNDFEMIVCTY